MSQFLFHLSSNSSSSAKHEVGSSNQTENHGRHSGKLVISSKTKGNHFPSLHFFYFLSLSLIFSYLIIFSPLSFPQPPFPILIAFLSFSSLRLSLTTKLTFSLFRNQITLSSHHFPHDPDLGASPGAHHCRSSPRTSEALCSLRWRRR